MFGKKKTQKPSATEHRTVIRKFKLGKIYQKIDVREYPMAVPLARSSAPAKLRTPSKIDRMVGDFMGIGPIVAKRGKELQELANKKRQHRTRTEQAQER